MAHQSPSTRRSLLTLLIWTRWIIAGRVKRGVNAALREQVRARALFDDAAMLEHDDPIDAMNGGEPMRHDESGSAVHQFLDRFHDGSFGGGIERGGRLVEQQDRRVLEKGARDPDALPLADAEMTAAFADRAVVTCRQAADEFVGLRALRGLADLLVRRVRPAVGDVFADRGREEKRVLQDDARSSRAAISW